MAPNSDVGVRGDGFSDVVANALMEEFSQDWNPPKSKKEQIAKMLDLTYLQVKTWFQNHRTRTLSPEQKAAKRAEQRAAAKHAAKPAKPAKPAAKSAKPAKKREHSSGEVD